MAHGFFKTGGFPYISKDAESQALIGRDFNSATSKNAVNTLPCRALNDVSPDLQLSCVSVVDPERPGWYLVHRDGFLYFEPEYAPRNPETFDADASFIRKRVHSSPGFTSLEAFSRPGHLLRATDDDQFVLAEEENTPEFRDSASMYRVPRDRKGELTSIVFFQRSAWVQISRPNPISNRPNPTRPTNGHDPTQTEGSRDLIRFFRILNNSIMDKDF